VSKINIFVSFDLEHDGDLYDQLLEQAASLSSQFEVSGRSEARARQDPWGEEMRRRIREADEVIVICGAHTDESPGVSAELRIAQEEKIPYFLLWGRRDVMCTKPAGAKAAEGMYSWTSQILRDQITLTIRNARWDERAASVAAAARKG
jgi:hypothetical protein